MKRLLIAAAVALMMNVAGQAAANILCFFEYEGPSTGLYKICYYDCLGEPAVITVSSAALCPLSINR